MVTCPSFPEIHYDKQTSDLHQHNCAIIVENIQEHHEGKWKCEFEIDVPNEDDPNEPVIIKEQSSFWRAGTDMFDKLILLFYKYLLLSPILLYFFLGRTKKRPQTY